MSSSTPSWISSLSTASIAADMAAADVNGTVTYAGLEKVFTDLDATLTSTKTTLTAAEFADLKTIAANLNNGMSTSSYLTDITQALVDGNAANATWTGGASTSTALGNLAAGSSATQLSELVGKWFMGTDLPNSAVSMDGSNFTVSYSTVSKPLFAATGPSMNDVNQGYLGDCYLLSSLAEVAYKNSGDITSMFTSNGNGTYGVRFYVDGVAEYVTVNSSLADGGNEFNSGADMWASLAEKAYAQLQASGAVTGNSISGNSWSSIGNGGAPEMALEEITGASAITDFDANSGSWMKVVYNSSFGVTGYTTGNATASVLSTLAADLANGDDVVLSSYTNATDSSGRTTLVADHAMSIYGYDTSTGMLEVRNPWGTESGQYWDTTFEVSLSTLLADGDTITADNIGSGSTPAHSAPVVTAQTAAQTWKHGQAISFKLASNTFTDPQGSALTYSAKLSSGAALPSWLTFNAATDTFSGTVANSASGLTIVVTATDGYGLSASETFTVATPAPAAPVVTAQTATQTWKLGQAVSFTLASNTFTDPQGEALTYSATLSNGAALPSWLTFNAATGKFTGTVPNTAAGLSIKVTATDAGGVATSETFSVLTPATAPALATQTATQTWKLGQAVNFSLASNTFTDPQGEALTYSATLSNGSALPSWLTFANGKFTGTVPNTAAGLSIKVTAKDSSGLTASETFSVLTPATAPALAAQTTAQTWKTGSTIDVALASNTFTDPQGEKLSYAATLSNGAALPAWLKFNGTTDTFTGTAPATATSFSVKVTATDTSGLSVSETFGVSVAATAAHFTQAIASTTGSSSSSSSFTPPPSMTTPPLASPLH
ncbi:MAG: putative Ig domain-containing protein [Xanthobacteraceae bacterium]